MQGIMEGIAGSLSRMREARRRALEALAGLTEEQLERPVRLPQGPTDVRYCLLSLALHDDERRVALAALYAALDWRPSEAARILALAAKVHGQLCALLLGVPPADLDRAPGPDDWSLREVLAHVEQTGQRYLLHTAYAVERLHSSAELPLRIPAERLPPTSPQVRSDEPLSNILERLVALHDRLFDELSGIGDEELAAPTIWTTWQVDVRFRLYRFAAHERQHLIQVAKVLNAVGFQQGEAQMILGQAESARGRLEGALIGLPRASALRIPAGGLPSVQTLLDDGAHDEEATVETILRATSAV
jgi:DinB superfamily